MNHELWKAAHALACIEYRRDMKIKKAFTLIELLVVIAIIGILATVVIINVASARGRANNAKVVNDMSVATRIAVQCNSEQWNVQIINANSPLEGDPLNSPPWSVCCSALTGWGSKCQTPAGPTGDWPYYPTQPSSTDGGIWQKWPYAVSVSSGKLVWGIFKIQNRVNISGFEGYYVVLCYPNGCKKTQYATTGNLESSKCTNSDPEFSPRCVDSTLW